MNNDEISQENPPVHMTLCADDYGISPAVGDGIRSLIEADRVTATSCMTASPFWREEAAFLLPLMDLADIGLHITLTDQVPLADWTSHSPSGKLPSQKELWWMAIRGQLPEVLLTEELDRQLDEFIAAFKRPPDFLDGHHHVHQIPRVRRLVLELFQRRIGCNPVYIRNTATSVYEAVSRRINFFRNMAIGHIGQSLKSLLKEQGILTNDSFSGIYGASHQVPYGPIFEKFLFSLHGRALVICHPGHVDDALTQADSLTIQREEEWRYLMSPAFLELLERNKIQLGRFIDMTPNQD